jgi:hypothetical protein
MRANAKQENSNLLSAEAYTGQCPVQCEQCFVNFGRSGRQSCNVIAKGKGPGAKEARKRARAYGWDGKSCLIWKEPDWEWFNHGPRMIRLPTGYVIPSILRISTLSDSSLSKKKWCQDILDLWGDHCFFNTTIRMVKASSRNLREVFHKVVVTVNGGYQQPYMVPPPPKGYTTWPKTIESAEVFARLAKGSMDAQLPKYRFATFDSPKTLSDIGLEDQESKVKFYRLRDLPTIQPSLETDLPVVHTMMRFNGVQNICEFARRYGLDLRYEGDSVYQRTVVQLFGFEGEYVKGSKNRVFLSTDADWNVSPFRGEETVLESFGGSWWRMRSAEDVNHLPWVCDARKLNCKGCGLCATLDATEPDGESPIMAEHDLHPIPYSRTYVEVPKKRAQRNPVFEGDEVGSLSESFFADILSEVFVRENPSAQTVTIVQDPSWVADALRELAGYFLKLEYYVEGWNTHEDAGDLLAYCFWALLYRAKREGMSKEVAWDWCRQFCLDATGYDLFEISPDLMLAWDNDGWMVQTFGPLE